MASWVDQRKLMALADELFAKPAKVTTWLEKVVKDVGKRAVNSAIDMTPPMKKGRNKAASKKALEEHVEKDVSGAKKDDAKDDVLELRYYTRVGEKFGRPYLYPKPKRRGLITAKVIDRKGRPVKNLRMVDAPSFIHQHTALSIGRRASYRRKTVQGLWFAKESSVKKAVKEKKAAVGKLAAGWYAGAVLCGNKGVPVWIKRHGSGKSEIKSRYGYVSVSIGNNVKYDRGHMGRISAWAVKDAEFGSKVLIEKEIEKLAKL